MYCIVFEKKNRQNNLSKIYSTKKFVKKIELHCIVFEKKNSQKNCIVLYCFWKKIIENICQNNCIVLFSKKKSTQKFAKKILLYCIVFEKRNLSKNLHCIVLYYFRKENCQRNLSKKLYCIVLEWKISQKNSTKQIRQKNLIVLYCFWKNNLSKKIGKTIAL